MADLTTDELMICHLIAQAIPLHANHDSCECRGEDTCNYCRFVAAGVLDHLIDNGYQVRHSDGSESLSKSSRLDSDPQHSDGPVAGGSMEP